MSRPSDTESALTAEPLAGTTLGAPVSVTPACVVPDTPPPCRIELPLVRYRLRFRRLAPHGGASSPPLPAGYLGSAWRGAFGHALRRAVCVTRLAQCDPCVLLRSCPYPFLFESRTPPGAKKLTRYPYTPGPYVLEPWNPGFDTDADGDGLDLGVILFGSANDHLPYVVHALDRAARQGLTARRIRFELRSVQVEARANRGGGKAGADPGADLVAATDAARDAPTSDPLDTSAGAVAAPARPVGVVDTDGAGGDHGTGGVLGPSDDWVTIFEPGSSLSPALPGFPPSPPVPRCVRVRLLTPLRILRDERRVGPADFTFRAFVGNLLRRLSLLTYFFAETPLETDFAGLLGRAESIPLADRRLRWHEWARRSSRQQAKVPMGGVVGSFVLEGEALAPFWPSLWLGQWTHVGKGCSMGLGRYVLEPMEAPGRPTARGASAPPPSSSGGWPAPRRL